MTGELPVKHQKLINYGQKKGKIQWAVSKKLYTNSAFICNHILVTLIFLS